MIGVRGWGAGREELPSILQLEGWFWRADWFLPSYPENPGQGSLGLSAPPPFPYRLCAPWRQRVPDLSFLYPQHLTQSLAYSRCSVGICGMHEVLGQGVELFGMKREHWWRGDRAVIRGKREELRWGACPAPVGMAWAWTAACGAPWWADLRCTGCLEGETGKPEKIIKITIVANI